MNQIRGFIHRGINNPPKEQEIRRSKSPKANRKSPSRNQFSIQAYYSEIIQPSIESNPQAGKMRDPTPLQVFPMACPTPQSEAHSITISERNCYSQSVNNLDSMSDSRTFAIPNKNFTMRDLEPIKEIPILEHPKFAEEIGYKIPTGKLQSREAKFSRVEPEDNGWGAVNYDLDLPESPDAQCKSLKERFAGRDWSG